MADRGKIIEDRMKNEIEMVKLLNETDIEEK
jgi:hypothetical protein